MCERVATKEAAIGRETAGERARERNGGTDKNKVTMI